ncbi:hypothetical protein BDR22DRAFT_245902 [Usnea florida]
MSSYLITGCSRGLGLELVKQLLLAPPSSVSTVLATSRSSSPSALLQEQIKQSESRIHHLQLDVNDKHSIQSASQHASQILDGRGLDVLINNAGIMSSETEEPQTFMHDLQPVLSTNVLAVHHVSSTFLPLLERGREKKLVNITSTLGSMGLNAYTKTMPFPAYKISKAALNMLTIQYANDLEARGFTVFCISPGWLRTDLGGPRADLAPDVGAKATMDVVYGSTRADNGAFRNVHVPGVQRYDGENPPW